MYKNINVNPACRRGDDCVIRALAIALDKTWEEVYIDLCIYGLKNYDMPSANHVWGEYLINEGYTRHIIPDSCPQCYTVRQFAEDSPKGTYILALHGHVVAVIDGEYCDTWDSGDEVPVYYWEKGE